MNEPTTSKSRRPPCLIIALALLVAGLALALLLVLTLRDALDPLARAEREAARWRAEQLDDQLAPLDLVVAAIWRLLPLVPSTSQTALPVAPASTKAKDFASGESVA